MHFFSAWTSSGAVALIYDGDGSQRISEEQIVSNAWTPSLYGYDGAGSVRQLTNVLGAVTDEYEYDAFGNSFTKTGTTPNNYLYRGEQFDSDLGLYYLRARYYNPATGRFMGRDPYDGNQFDPKTLHKYLYTAGDPVNRIDPRGRLFEYVIESSAAIPEARLISIYGCVADASLALVDFIIDPTLTASSALGGASTIIGCVTLTPALSELAEEGNVILKRAEIVANTLSFGACASDTQEFVNGLNSVLSGSSDAGAIAKSVEVLVGCVGDALSYLLTHPGTSLQLGL